ncbi:MAG: SIR2 family protein [Bacteroidia bacterium]
MKKIESVPDLVVHFHHNMAAFNAVDRLKEVIQAKDVILVTGIGTSIATLGKPDPNGFVTWKGLLRSGLVRILETKGEGFRAKYDRKTRDLEEGDVFDWMSIGDVISEELQPVGIYRKWLKETIGSLPKDELKEELITTLANTGFPILTTNYDDYFNLVADLNPVLWTQDDHAREVVTGKRKGVLHLHGHWDHPDSIVLGRLQYEKFRNSAFINWLIQSILIHKTLVFVGMGDGINDPNFIRFRNWIATVLADTTNEHFYLCLDEDVEPVKEKLNADARGRITPIPYGEGFDKLVPFLKTVFQPADSEKQTLNISQPPLPKGFMWLQRQASSKKANSFRDFLDSSHLPYLSRKAFRANLGLDANGLETEDDWSEMLFSDENSGIGGLIHGEGGIGKTRLMLELGLMAIDRGFQVIRVLPQATTLQPLWDHLNLQEKYLLLFDYIEENEAYSLDEFDALLQRFPTTKFLANCRTSTLSGHRVDFGDRIRKIDLSTEGEMAQRFEEGLVRHIIEDLLPENHSQKDFFEIKPAFAVFLRYLAAIGKLQTDDLRQIGDFGQWVKHRILLLFEAKDLLRIPDRFAGLIASFPIERGKEAALRGDQELDNWLIKLETDGWIDRLPEEEYYSLAFSHDTLADEILLQHLAPRKVAVQQTVSKTLDFALEMKCLQGWIRAQERIAPFCKIDQKHFATALRRAIPRYPDALKGVEWLIGMTNLISEDERLWLYRENVSLFSKQFGSKAFGGNLVFSINWLLKGKIEGGHKEFLSDLLRDWIGRNPDYLDFPWLAHRILSIKWRLWGLDSGAESDLRGYAARYIQAIQASFVISVWIESGGNIDAIRAYVVDYLQFNDVAPEAQFVMVSWLYASREYAIVEEHLLKYLSRHSESAEAQFALKAWLDAKGSPSVVEEHLLKYLSRHSESAEASFVFASWFRMQLPFDNVMAFLHLFLRRNAQHRNAGFVLASFVTGPYHFMEVREYILDYLDSNAGESIAGLIMEAWLNNKQSCEEIRIAFSKWRKNWAGKIKSERLSSRWLQTECARSN